MKLVVFWGKIGFENKKTFWTLGNEGIKANSEGLLEIKLWEWLQSSSDTSMKSKVSDCEYNFEVNKISKKINLFNLNLELSNYN